MTSQNLRPRADRVVRAKRIALLCAWLLATTATRSHAGSTDPVLGIGTAVARGSGAAAVLELAGTWAFDDILQVDFPLNAVVSQGTTFVRFPVGQPAESGTFAGLADGLQANEIAVLESAGTLDADASIVRIEQHGLVMALPPIFANGALRVVLYVVLPAEGSFLSNVLDTPIAGVGGAR